MPMIKMVWEKSCLPGLGHSVVYRADSLWFQGSHSSHSLTRGKTLTDIDIGLVQSQWDGPVESDVPLAWRRLGVGVSVSL